MSLRANMEITMNWTFIVFFLVNEYVLEIFLLHNKTNIKWICSSVSSLFKITMRPPVRDSFLLASCPDLN